MILLLTMSKFTYINHWNFSTDLSIVRKPGLVDHNYNDIQLLPPPLSAVAGSSAGSLRVGPDCPKQLPLPQLPERKWQSRKYAWKKRQILQVLVIRSIVHIWHSLFQWCEASRGLFCWVISGHIRRAQCNHTVQVLVRAWAQCAERSPCQVDLAACGGPWDRSAGGYWLTYSKFWRVRVGKNMCFWWLHDSLRINSHCYFVVCWSGDGYISDRSFQETLHSW